uniref:Ubiquitin-like protease family profile domain-containing protein n=1 Tax=Taeniopygia guttata TaxID=59729 RepID=A0A674GCK2_TAEGU
FCGPSPIFKFLISRSCPERFGGGARPGLPLPPLPGANPDQQRHRRGRGRGGATPPGEFGHAPRPGHAPRGSAQPPPAGGARDLRAEHPGRVPSGLREPHPRQRRRSRGEARGHFPAGVQHPPEVMNMYGDLVMDAVPDKVHFFNSFFYDKLRTRGYEGVQRWTKNVRGRGLNGRGQVWAGFKWAWPGVGVARCGRGQGRFL